MAVDDQIDDILADGPNTASNIARRTGSSRQYVWDRLNARDDIERVDDGLYRLTGPSRSVADEQTLIDLRDRVGRLKMELTKQNETPDELWDRADEIHKSLKNALKELDD